MAVIIHNLTSDSGGKYGEGEQLYELKINIYHKCYFTHNFEDGLAECLRKAADAFEAEEGKHE